MRIQFLWAALVAIVASTLVTGCGGMLRNLRGGEFEDGMANMKEPTSGGMWPERGWLDDSDYDDRSEAVARIERQVGGAQGEIKDGAKRGLASAEGKAADAKSGTRAKKEDFIDQAQGSGSLWASDGQTNYFFTKNRIKTVGDIISVQIEDQMAKDISSEVKRTLTKSEREYELTLANEEKEAAQSSGSSRKPASTDPAAAAAEAAPTTDAREVSMADLDLSKHVGVKTGDTIMAEILERYPNGNYKVKGTKRVPYRSNTRLVQFTGIARGTDIDDGDQVASGKFYEYRLNVERPGAVQ